MDDEIKGIPRRYTEDEWRELTKKKAKGIRPIFKQLALLVSVMIGVALAVSAYTDSGSVGISGQVVGSSFFNIEVYDEDTQTWVSDYVIQAGQIVSGQTKQFNLKIRWSDNTIYTKAKCTGCHLVNTTGLSMCSIDISGQTLNEGQSYDVILSVTASGQSFSPISGEIMIDFEIEE
ncbi:MAG: hypothetical protein ACTSPB_20255 [Candidatus Thorarchaeota archaeon]